MNKRNLFITPALARPAGEYQIQSRNANYGYSNNTHTCDDEGGGGEGGGLLLAAGWLRQLLRQSAIYQTRSLLKHIALQRGDAKQGLAHRHRVVHCQALGDIDCYLLESPESHSECKVLLNKVTRAMAWTHALVTSSRDTGYLGERCFGSCQTSFVIRS